MRIAGRAGRSGAGLCSVAVGGTSYTWEFVELDQVAPAPADTTPDTTPFSVGDRVRVRDGFTRPWRAGTVTQTQPTVEVEVDEWGRGSYTWNYIEELTPARRREMDSTRRYATPARRREVRGDDYSGKDDSSESRDKGKTFSWLWIVGVGGFIGVIAIGISIAKCRRRKREAELGAAAPTNAYQATAPRAYTLPRPNVIPLPYSSQTPSTTTGHPEPNAQAVPLPPRRDPMPVTG